ncbi:MAG TPA: hypothetical protein VHA06_06345 [Candidatus Angelobacter sp.]|nr:hypothetical protein [Candidatus Angelobacter sp.]
MQIHDGALDSLLKFGESQLQELGNDNDSDNDNDRDKDRDENMAQGLSSSEVRIAHDADRVAARLATLGLCAGKRTNSGLVPGRAEVHD